MGSSVGCASISFSSVAMSWGCRVGTQKVLGKARTTGTQSVVGDVLEASVGVFVGEYVCAAID